MSTENMENVTRQTNGTQHEKAYRRTTFAPPIDIYENADEVLVVADVPGCPAESISLDIEKDVLTLRAARRSIEAEGRRERRAIVTELAAVASVEYARTFRIPPGIDSEKITAEMKHGTLLVRLPKSEKAKPRQIAVKPA